MKKLMKALLVSMVLLFPLSAIAADFFDPSKFTGTEEEKKQVIAFIEENVKKTYSNINMDDPATLRMMEKQELDSFKKLTKAENKKLLDAVIKQYCGIGMCNYNTISMMYDQQLQASQKKLEW